MRWLKTLAIVLIVALVALGGRWLLLSGHGEGGVGTVSTTGTAAIGGPFTLQTAGGRTVTEADFAGRYMLIYFGYTYCPDVCPTALGEMGRALDMLPPEQAGRIQPLFITVDPDRDSPDDVAEYAGHFHARMMGLSGTPEQIAAVSRAYRVYAAKVEEDPADPMTYLMDHSAISYLMGPDGAFVTHLSHSLDAAGMAKVLAERVN